MKRILAALALLALLSSGARATNWYVKPAARGGDNTHGGTDSTTDALATLNEAAKKAACGDTVFICGGTYYSNTAQILSSSCADCIGTTGVTFKGIGNPYFDTIGWEPTSNSTLISLNAHAVLDGVTIDGHDTNAITAGVFAGDSATVKNCTIIDCRQQGAFNYRNTGTTIRDSYFANCGTYNTQRWSIYYQRGGKYNSVIDCVFDGGSGVHYNGWETDAAALIATGYWQYGGEVSGNIFIGCDYPFTPQNTDSLLVDNNLFICPTKLRFINLGYGCSVADDNGYGRASKRIMFINNTMVGDGNQLIWAGESDRGDGGGGQFIFFNNIAINNYSTVFDTSGTHLTPSFYLSSNILTENTTYKWSQTPTMQQVFVNPLCGASSAYTPAGDFHILEGSIAHAAGLSLFQGLTPPPTDIDGTSYGLYPDIGCYAIEEVQPPNPHIPVTWYVNSSIGSDDYTGKSKRIQSGDTNTVGPLATLAAAADSTLPGDIVHVTGTFLGSAARIIEGDGTASANIEWYGGGSTYLDGNGYGAGELVNIGSHNVIDGFDIDCANTAIHAIVASDSATYSNLVIHNNANADGIYCWYNDAVTISICDFDTVAATDTTFSIAFYGADAGEGAGNIISRCTFSDCGAVKLSGVVADSTTRAIYAPTIYRNKFTRPYNAALIMNAVRRAVVEDNVTDSPRGAVNIYGGGFSGGMTSDSCYVVNNTLYDPANSAPLISIVESGGSGGGEWVVFNNVVVTDGTVADSTGTLSPSHFSTNYLLATNQTAILGAIFTDRDNGDLSPTKDGVTIINQGVASYWGISAPGYDHNGARRPYWGRFDIGAYELQAPAGITPTNKKFLATQ